MKKLLPLLLASFLFLLVVTPSFAAAPDGLGPWADSVISSSQGLTKGGGAVPAARSNPLAALGVAENDTVDSHFFSLGFGGKITLGFDNGISSGVIVVEATNPGYPAEKAKVEVSADGSTWYDAGTISQDGQVNKPAQVGCAKYVKLTDVSNPSDFPESTADGYDVDGVQAVGDVCQPVTPTPTPCCNGCSTVTQTNTTTITNVISSNANTGKTKANKNTGGSNIIVTGDSSSNVSVTNTGSTNTATSTGCYNGSSISVTISGNGAGSTNTVTINNGKVKKLLR